MMSLSTKLKEVIAFRRSQLGTPPDPEVIAAYREKRLTDDERNEFLEYAAVDRPTADALLEAVRFPDIENDEEQLTPLEIEHQWKRFQAFIEQESNPESSLKRVSRPRRDRFETLVRWAASVVLAVGLGFGVGWQFSQNHQPRINQIPLSLSPDNSSQGLTRSTNEPLSIPEASAGLLLNLSLESPESFEYYRLELHTASGLVWSNDQLVASIPGVLILDFPKERLGKGTLRFELYGTDEIGAYHFLDAYSFEILSINP